MQDYTSKPVLPKSDTAYFRQRQKNKVFHAVMAHFTNMAESEGLSKKDLAVKLNKDPAQITRWLSGPSNWTLDTVSDLLLAMDAEMEQSIVSLKDRRGKNINEPILYGELSNRTAGMSGKADSLTKSLVCVEG